MIDIHSHILPGIDDGPQTMAESVELARIYEKAGFTRVIATPHCIPGTVWNLSVERVTKRIADLNTQMATEGIQLEILPGMEIGMDPSVGGLLKKGELLTLADSAYVLLETPFQQLPLNWEEIVFDLLSSGFQIILAHPERCGQLVGESVLFEKMVKIGCFMQVNMDSVLGFNGSKIAKLTQQIVQRGYVHCLATDTHDIEYRNAAHLAKAMDVLGNWIGTTRTNTLVQTNPLHVLRSRTLETFPTTPIKPQKSGLKRVLSWFDS